MKRCFGVKKKVVDCDWAELKSLRSLKAPHEPMPRLVDVLEYLRQPSREHIWVLLDIKVLVECCRDAYDLLIELCSLTMTRSPS